MKRLILLTLIILFGFSSCKTSNNKSCELFYQSYGKFRNESKVDSALFYIDKTIQCNKNDFFYKIEKTKYLISIEKYRNAIVELESVKKEDESSEVNYLKGVLLLKIRDEDGLVILTDVYKNYKREEKTLNSDSLYYYLTLVNFFDGKDATILKINENKQKYADDLATYKTLDLLQSLISTKSKEEVMFKITNIN